MEVLKIKSNNTDRYGLFFTKRNNQLFLDLHIGRTTWMVSFTRSIK